MFFDCYKIFTIQISSPSENAEKASSQCSHLASQNLFRFTQISPVSSPPILYDIGACFNQMPVEYDEDEDDLVGVDFDALEAIT